MIYWTDRTAKTLLSCYKYDCDNKTIHKTSLKEPLGLTALHPLRHPCDGLVCTYVVAQEDVAALILLTT